MHYQSHIAPENSMMSLKVDSVDLVTPKKDSASKFNKYHARRTEIIPKNSEKSPVPTLLRNYVRTPAPNVPNHREKSPMPIGKSPRPVAHSPRFDNFFQSDSQPMRRVALRATVDLNEEPPKENVPKRRMPRS